MTALMQIVAVGLMLFVDVGREAPIDLSVLDEPFSATCVECKNCAGGNEHLSKAGSGSGGGIHPNCLSGDCLTVHGVCGGDPGDDPEGLATVPLTNEERGMLRHALLASDGDLKGVVGQLGNKVSFSAERRALQIHGCGSSVIAHIPLQRAQVQALAE